MTGGLTNFDIKFACMGKLTRGRNSSVGIATRYGQDGLGIESRWGGGEFSSPVHTGPGAHPASYTMGTWSFLGVKRPGRGADHPVPPKCRGHERVELYLYSPSGPSWPVIGRALPYLTCYSTRMEKSLSQGHFVRQNSQIDWSM